MLRGLLALLPALLLLAAACLGESAPPPFQPLPGPDASAPADGGLGPDAGPDAGSPATPDAGLDVLPGPADGSVRIATFNTRLFFDPVCQSGQCGSGDFEQKPSEEAFGARAQQIADGLRRLSPSVVLLEEVETRASLDALSSRLGDVLPYALIAEKGYAGSVDVAVLSSGTFLEEHRHGSIPLYRPDGSSTSFTREFLEVHFRFGTRRVIVFAAHFRSKNSDDPGRRLAEAQAAKQIVTSVAAAHPEALIVLGGDLNDVPGSEPIHALEGSGELLRVAAELPAAEQITYFGYGGNALDHLFFATSASGRYLPGTAQVLHEASKGYAGSDHAPLFADFGL